MVIKKLNKFFHDHSRVIFGIFAVLIILAFMPVSSNFGGCQDPQEEVIGTAFGDDVTVGDLQKLYRNFSNYFLLIGQQQPQMNTEMLFDYYCLIKRAGQLGICVTDDEVVTALAANPAFQENNRFSAEKYNTFLTTYHLTDEDVAEAIRSVEIISKLQRSLADSVAVSEEEARIYYGIFKSGFNVKICSVAISGFTVDDPTDADLQAYYDANKSSFMSPGKSKIVVALVPFEAFKAQVTVTAEEIAAAKTSLPGKSDDEVREVLVMQKAAELAGSAANRLGSTLYSELDGTKTAAEQIQFFRDWAATNGLVIEEKEIAFDGTDFSRRLQSMPLTGSRLVGAMLPAANGIQIVMLAERIEPQQMSFEDAKEAVTNAWKAEKQLAKARETLTAEIQRIKGLEAGEQADAFVNMDIPGKSYKDVQLPLTQQAIFQDFSLFQWYNILPQLTMTMATGDISDIIPMGDSIAVVRVTSRTPADVAEFDAEKAAFIEQMRMMKAQALFEEFVAEIKRQCQLTIPVSGDEETPAE